LLVGQLIGSPASNESGNLFACAMRSSCTSRRIPRRDLADDTRTQGVDWARSWQKLVATATSPELGIEKPASDRYTACHYYSSAEPPSVVKIGQVDVQIIGPTEIAENETQAFLPRDAMHPRY